MELKDLAEQLKTTFQEFKGLNDRAEAEAKKLGEVTQETKAAVEAANGRLDALEAKMNRPPVLATAAGTTPEIEARKSAFGAWLRKGAMGPEQAKALTVGDDSTGGFLAPPEILQEVQKGVILISPVRELATVRQTSNRAVMIPKRTSTLAAAWVSEIGTRSETTGTGIGMEEIPTHEMTALVDVSQQDLEDSAFNLEEYLAAEFAEQFGLLEGTAFISGNGVGKPEGISVQADVEQINSGAAALLTSDGLMDLAFGLKDSYARNATWAMKRSTIKAIRKLKTGAGDYIWQPGLSGAIPATILDRPYVECNDIAAVGAGNLAIYFGDFKRGYLIVDRVQMSILRDQYTQAATGKVRFIARKRVGGQVILPEAIKIQKVSA